MKHQQNGNTFGRLQEHERILKLVRPEAKAMLLGHLADIDSRLQPGTSVLTWSSLNIDGYLHHVLQVNLRACFNVGSEKRQNGNSESGVCCRACPDLRVSSRPSTTTWTTACMPLWLPWRDAPCWTCPPASPATSRTSLLPRPKPSSTTQRALQSGAAQIHCASYDTLQPCW